MSLPTLGELVEMIDSIVNIDDLEIVMARICAILGFDHFALSHHVDVNCAAPSVIRLNNYPPPWAEFYYGNACGVSDPVHRASHVTSVGFRWSQIPAMIPLTTGDLRMLDLGREAGIGDGFTIPANVPGEMRGSCSFAITGHRPLPVDVLPLAQLAGAFAFECARNLAVRRGIERSGEAPALTDRQRECVMWVARGKTDWEVSKILGVTEETVTRHMKQARERYGVPKRTLLAIRALFDGTLSFDDILMR